MRKKILGVAVLAAAVAIALFGLPLAYAVHRIYFDDEHGEVERAALRVALHAAATLPDTASALPTPYRQDGVILGLYDAGGRRLAGLGADIGDAAVQDARAGTVIDRTIGAELVVAVPVYDGDRIVAVARAASPRTNVERRVVETWGLMLGLAALAAGCASALAARQARRLALPLIHLEQVAEELGDGNFAVRAEPCGVTEIDRAGAALNRTAERLDDILAGERAFTAVASHQLRTPLTSLRLGLEHALDGPDESLRAAAAEAMTGADRLSATIDDVLALARGGGGGELFAAGPVLTQAQARWSGPLRGAGRALVVRAEDPPLALASPAAVRQILDVLLDNALHHGRGTVTVIARASSDALAIDVLDEGHAAVALIPDASTSSQAPRRLGLALAASLAAAQGGRLVHARTDPTTRLTVLLPAAVEEGGGDGGTAP